MPQTLDHLLLRLINATSHISAAELPRETWLRSGKAAELAAALVAAICLGAETLHKTRMLYPFFHLLSPALAPARGELPAALRGSWDKLQDGTLIAAGADLALWRACVETAHHIYSSAPATTHLPLPSVQVSAKQGRPVLLTPLNIKFDDSCIAPELRSVVRSGVREGQPCIGDRVLLCGHFDPHGLAMLMASWLHLQSQGATQVQAVCGYTETGDYGKFWKRTLPKLAAGDGSFTHAVIVDMTVYARDHSRTLDTLKKVSGAGVKVHLVDHHLDTLGCVQEMTQAGAEVVLADIPGCFYGDSIGLANLPYIAMGAVGDREVSLGLWLEGNDAPPWGREAAVAEEDVALIIHALSPPPPELKNASPFPLETLLIAAQKGFSAFARQIRSLSEEGFALPQASGEKLEKAWFAPPKPKAPDRAPVESVQLGKVLLVPGQIETAGREWYEELERLLAANPTAHYALAGRYLPGTGFNFLCLKDWRDVAAPAPLAFVPEDERAQTLGHYGAFWFNIAEAADAEAKLCAFIKRINAHFGVPGGKVAAAVRSAILRIVDTRAEGTRSRKSSSDRMF